MVALVANWVKQGVSGTPGTGTISLGSAQAGFIGFDQAFSTGNTVHYSIEDGNNREIGIGTLTSGSPWTLARTTVLESLDGGVYDNTSPAAISLTSAAVVGVAPIAYMPGSLIGEALVEETALVSVTSTTLPHDDTIPQNTEGAEILSVAYTPKYTGSLLKIRVELPYVHAAATGVRFSVALFSSLSADAIGICSNLAQSAGGHGNEYIIEAQLIAPSTSSITFSARAGSANTQTAHINGQSAARVFGGKYVSYLRVSEYRQ